MGSKNHCCAIDLDTKHFVVVESYIGSGFKLLSSLFFYATFHHSSYSKYKIISYILTFFTNKINHNKTYDLYNFLI
jgi:hypothetical protein